MTSSCTELGAAITHWFISTNISLALLVLAGFALERMLKGRLAPALRIWLYAPALLRFFYINPLPGIRSWIGLSSESPNAVDAQWIRIPLPAWTHRIHFGHASSELAASGSASADVWIVATYDIVLFMYILITAWLGIKVVRGCLATVKLRHESVVIRSPPKLPNHGTFDPIHQADQLILCIPKLSIQLQQQLDAYRITLCEHAQIGPAACGITKPMIVLPHGVLHAIKASELEAVLAHEIAHLRRRDPLFVTCLNFMCAVAWPLLPLWFARARILSLIELAADEKALGLATIQERRAYGRVFIIF